MSSFPHHQQNGQWVSRPLTVRPRIDRITTPNVRTKYKGEGVTLGAFVTGSGTRLGWGQPTRISGQVWAQAAPFAHNNRGFWWIVDDQGAVWAMHIDGHAQQDEPLEGLA